MNESPYGGKRYKRSVSAEMKIKVLERDWYRCVQCSRTLPEVRLEIDHKVPIAAGGDNHTGNLQTLCAPCNREKGAKMLTRFVPFKQQLDKNNQKDLWNHLVQDFEAQALPVLRYFDGGRLVSMTESEVVLGLVGYNLNLALDHQVVIQETVSRVLGKGKKVTLVPIEKPGQQGEDPETSDTSEGMAIRGISPEEVVRSFGGKSEDIIDYLLGLVKASCSREAPIERKLEVLEKIYPYLNGEREAVRRECIRRISRWLKIDEDLVEFLFFGHGRHDERVVAAVEVRARTEAFPPAEKLLVQILLNRPDFVDRMKISPSLFSNSVLADIVAAVVECRDNEEIDVLQFDVTDMARRMANELKKPLRFEDAEADRAVQDCLTRIRGDRLKRESQNWELKVDEAKRRGNEEEVLTLLKERENIRKEQVGLHLDIKRAQEIMGDNKRNE